GRCRLPGQRALVPGAVLELRTLVGELLDLRRGARLVARGELVMVPGGRYGVRIIVVVDRHFADSPQDVGRPGRRAACGYLVPAGEMGDLLEVDCPGCQEALRPSCPGMRGEAGPGLEVPGC